MGLAQARLRLVTAGPAAKPESPAFRKTAPKLTTTIESLLFLLLSIYSAVCFLVREAVPAVSCDRTISPLDMHG